MNILLAIDSSASAHAALMATLARPWPAGTDFRVLTVVPDALRDKIRGGQISPDLSQAQRLVNVAMSRIESRNVDSIVTGEILVGNPAKTIAKLADSWPADLVIVGSHDFAPLERFLMGSVSKSVLHKANCSVLVARDHADGLMGCRQMDRVMLTVDDSPSSKAAVDFVLKATWPEETQFYILSVRNPFYSGFVYEPSSVMMANALDYEEEYRRNLEDSMHRVLLQFQNRFGAFNIEFCVMEGRAENVIPEVARDWGAQLIVLGSHGRQDPAKRSLGSVPDQVAMQANCSVQVIRTNLPQPTIVRDRRQEPVSMSSTAPFKSLNVHHRR
ncbi:MAG: universal stress protein [Candidatus Melainabacteria bacterium]|nr:universal stress protein [Candidatus Melainabacteria bacterium]